MEKENTFISSPPHGLHGFGGGNQRRGRGGRRLRWTDAAMAATAWRRRRSSRRRYASFRSWEPWLRPPLITAALLPALLGMAHAQAQRVWRHGATTPALKLQFADGVWKILKEMQRILEV